MDFVQNVPLFQILLTLVCAVVTSVLQGRTARNVTLFAIAANLIMNAAITAYTVAKQVSYVYWMGHFPAPWGNEIRAGGLETACLMVFLIVILLSFLGGSRKNETQIEPTKINIFYVLTDLLMLSLLVLVYTNDLFTAYVFIEINTLAAAGLVMVRQNGKGLVASLRYVVMNLLGSSLFLIGVVLLYTITGHLLMENIHESVVQLSESGKYSIPLAAVVGLISVGLAMKSALFPFEKWLPGAYSNSTPTASALLSSIVSKGYIFLLVKFYVRVIGLDVIRELGVCDVLFVCGALGMIMGSVNAIRARTTRMMVAYSSIAQIGYIFLAIGMGTEAGMLCAVWHVLVHCATKSMLFLATGELDEGMKDFSRVNLKGSFYRCRLPALAFVLGAVNLVGIPFLGTFVTKVTMAQAAMEVGGRHAVLTLVCLAISTMLNVGYFLSSAVEVFTPDRNRCLPVRKPDTLVSVCLIGMMILNLVLGVFSAQVFAVLGSGLARFA